MTSLKVLKVERALSGESHEAKLRSLLEYLEDMHLAIGESGVSYVGVIQYKDERVRIVSAAEHGKLLDWLRTQEDDALEYEVFKLETRQ